MSNFFSIDTNTAEWITVEKGVEKIVLCEEPGQRRSLIRFAPGTVYHTHRHPQGEEVFILEGYLKDKGVEYGPGSYLHFPPGSVHTPSSPKGCTFLLLLPVAVDFLQQENQGTPSY
jgi:quercetin dioxygenase-like cupin family protein